MVYSGRHRRHRTTSAVTTLRASKAAKAVILAMNQAPFGYTLTAMANLRVRTFRSSHPTSTPTSPSVNHLRTTSAARPIYTNAWVDVFIDRRSSRRRRIRRDDSTGRSAGRDQIRLLLERLCHRRLHRRESLRRRPRRRVGRRRRTDLEILHRRHGKRTHLDSDGRSRRFLQRSPLGHRRDVAC
ncbi:MAG: hypothetical protein MZU97_24275 [Bacillus subtilis]|nr:hypothetical protein [Bacillus subtilis]